MERAAAKHLASVYVKGIGMGAADIVPGVSGGTIAFITGIYQELIDSIGSIGPKTLRILFKEGVVAAWNSINATFLLVLMLGILTSVFTLSKMISHLLHTYPELLWSFFFGLILVSALHVGRTITQWRMSAVVNLVLGVVVAFGITSFSPAQIPLNPINLFLAGCIAICAMVLPGISGSFILLLMGMYAHVIGAVKSLDVVNLGIFAAGCLVGILAFTRLLSWFLHHYKNATLALLTGFMLGSLNKIWPWKQTLSTRINSKGEQVPVDQVNVMPDQFMALTGKDPQLLYSIGLMILAIILVLAMEFVASQKGSGKQSQAES